MFLVCFFEFVFVCVHSFFYLEKKFPVSQKEKEKELQVTQMDMKYKMYQTHMLSWFDPTQYQLLQPALP